MNRQEIAGTANTNGTIYWILDLITRYRVSDMSQLSNIIIEYQMKLSDI